MKVESIKIVNFKGIKGVDKKLEGRSVYVLGKNAGGKTTFIDAVFMALTGKNMPSEPIKKGEKEAKIEVDLGGGSAVIVDFAIKAGKTTQKLTYLEDGAIVKESPRARLNELIGTVDFDPFEFMNKSPKEQLDYFLKIAGINTAKLDQEYQENLDLIKLEKNELKKHDLVPYDEELAALEERPTSEVVAALDKAKDKNRLISETKTKIDQKVERGKVVQTEIDKLLAELDTLNGEVEKWMAWYSKQTPTPLEPLQAAVDNLDKNNKAIREAREVKKSNELREKLQENIDGATEANKKLREDKEALVNNALKGIEGVTFDGEQFLLNKLPFEANQGNTAAQIIAGLQIGLKMLGEVRIARFEGSLLDDANLSSVEKWAEENDLQLFIEMVDRSGEGLKIELIEEGAK